MHKCLMMKSEKEDFPIIDFYFFLIFGGRFKVEVEFEKNVTVTLIHRPT